MKNIKWEGFTFIIFFLFSFFSVCWGTDFADDPIHIEGEVPNKNQTWHDIVTVEWFLTEESAGESYLVQYSTNGSGGPFYDCRGISPNPYPTPPSSGGVLHYIVSWNTREDIPDTQSNCWIKISCNVDAPGGYYRISGPFTIQNTYPKITITSPTDGGTYSGTISINFKVENTWPDDTYTVEYSSDGGSSWNKVVPAGQNETNPIPATSDDPAYLSLTWNTVLLRNGTYRIRVTTSVSGQIVSTGDFTIDNTPNVTITASISPSEPDGRIDRPVAYPMGDPDNYFGIPLGIDERTGWYVTHPTITIKGTTTDPRDTILYTFYRVIPPGNWQSVNGDSVTINFSNYDDGQYQVEFFFRVQRDYGGSIGKIQYDTPITNIPNDLLQEARGVGGISWDTGSDPTMINIDTTPPSVNLFRVNKPPDGKWAKLKDTNELVHWYDTNPDNAPIIYFIPDIDVIDETSGLFIPDNTGLSWGIHAHSIDTSMPIENDNLLQNFCFDSNSLTELNINTTDIPPSAQSALQSAFYFPVYNARGKPLRVGVFDRAGNFGYLEDFPVLTQPEGAQKVPLYVDTIPPRTRVEISTDDSGVPAIWPDWPKDVGIPVDQHGNDDGENRRWYSWLNNLGFRRPEDATPPTGYSEPYIDYLYFASSENQSRSPTKIRLISTDTPRYIGTPEKWSLWPGWQDPKYDEIRYETQFDPRFSDFSPTNYGSGVSDDYNMPKYRITSNTENDIRNNDSLWEEWIFSTTEYSFNSNLYEDVSPSPINDWSTITEWIFLPKRLTSIEYFAIDNAGNEEKDYYTLTDEINPQKTHHIICDEGGGLVKGRVISDLGKSNLRADDNVPDPDLELSFSSQNPYGENGWYKSQVNITLTYNNPNNWKDPLSQFLPEEIVPGSGIKKFQYAIKNNPDSPSEADFVDYTYGRPISLSDGIYWFYYRAIDNLGNRSGNILRPYIIYPNNPIKIDTVYPVTTISINGDQITLTATDGTGSGIQYIEYALLADETETPNWIKYPGSSVTFTLPEGKKIVKYRARDNAGNQEPDNISNLGEMDTSPPTTFIQVQGPIYETDSNIYITSNLNSNPTRFILTATDGGGSGIRTGYPKYKLLPSGTEYSYTGPFSVFSTTTEIQYWSKDIVNNEEIPHKKYPESKTLVIDDTPPTLSFNVSCSDPSKVKNGWYNSLSGMPEVTINSDDGSGSGVSSVLYDLNGGVPSTTYSGSFPLSDGIYNLISRAIDNLGNTTSDTPYPSNPIKVDTTAPSSSLSFDNGVFTLSATDNFSGVKTINYVLIYSDDTPSDTQTFYASSTQFVIPPGPGVKAIEYWAVDVAGNEETPHKKWNTSEADNTPPQTTITYSPPYYIKETDLYVTSGENTTSLIGKTQFSITSNDPVVNNFSSGIAVGYPKYRIDSSVSTDTTYVGPFTVSPGDTKIYAYAKDGAGNTEIPEKTLTFKVDDDPPTTPTIEIKSQNPPYNGPASTGWYNSITGPAKIIFTGSTDEGSGVKGVRYTTDGSNPGLNSPFVNLDTEIIFDDVKIDTGNFVYVAFDNLENRGETQIYTKPIWVDTKPPKTEIKITKTIDGKMAFELIIVENIGPSKFDHSEYIFNSFDRQNMRRYPGVPVEIPKGTTKIYAISYDEAGNYEDPPVEKIIPSNIKISGYVRDYKGNPVAGVKLILSGDATVKTSTDSSGYYEFTNLSAIGDYYIVPLIENSMPFRRSYNGIGENDLTDQNFVILNGWMSKYYDKGNSNEYYFKTTKTLPENSILTTEYTFGRGGDILTGDIDSDGKLDILIKDSTTLSAYTYNSQTKSYENKFTRSSNYALSLIDNVDLDTYLEILLTGSGKELSEIYGKDGDPIKTISLPTPPDDTKWAIRFAQNNILFAGDGTNYETIVLYDNLSDEIIWDTGLSYKIEPEYLSLCVREDGKVMILTGTVSETSHLIVYSIDAFTGNKIWEKKINYTGKIRVFTSDLDNDGYKEIIGVLISDDIPVQVYLMNRTNGNISKTYSPGIYTDDFKIGFGDIDADGTKEIVLTDDNQNLYVIDIISGIQENPNAGKLWAVVDFDGKSDNKKEIVLSKESYIKVLNSDLNEIFSYDLEDTISKVIVSDTNNDGIIEIIVSSPTKTYILRPSTQADSPPAPTNLNGFAGPDGVYLSWSCSGSDLEEFRIYRSIDGIKWNLVGTVAADRTSYIDIPPPGIWYYKVSSYNKFGEVDCKNPESILVEYSGPVPEGGGGGGCFIATTCFGKNSWQVKILKEFRDRYLIRTGIGRKFVKLYYSYSPYISKYLENHRILIYPVRAILYILIFLIIIPPVLPYILLLLSSYLLIKQISKFFN